MFEIGVADCASNDRLNSCRGLFFVGVFFFASGVGSFGVIFGFAVAPADTVACCVGLVLLPFIPPIATTVRTIITQNHHFFQNGFLFLPQQISHGRTSPLLSHAALRGLLLVAVDDVKGFLRLFFILELQHDRVFHGGLFYRQSFP